MCAFVSLHIYVEPGLRSKDCVVLNDFFYYCFLSVAYTCLLLSVPEIKGIYAAGGHPF